MINEVVVDNSLIFITVKQHNNAFSKMKYNVNTMDRVRLLAFQKAYKKYNFVVTRLLLIMAKCQGVSVIEKNMPMFW